MCHRKLLYSVGTFLFACVVGCWCLWFVYYRPIIPKGEVGEIQFETRVDESSGIKNRMYDIGVFFVPENRNNPDSRVIVVDYVRYHAKENTAPPVFVLPGGPGNTYIGQTPDVWKIPYLEKLRSFSDVVLVNQRGCSNRRRDWIGTWRRAPTPKTDSTLEDRVLSYKEFAKQVTADYAGSDVDLRGYTITECAADVDDLRRALGYKKITLMGQSFGSQWCFAVMRQHPEIVERAILTGVEPLNHTYDMPSHVMNAIRRIWRHLDTDPAWAPFLPPGGMEEAAEEVLTRLENGGIEVKDSHGKTKMVLGPDDFPWDYPAEILELFHGQTEHFKDRRKLSRGVHFPLIDSSTGITADRLEKLLNDPAVRYVSSSNFAKLLATADIWPSPDIGDEFRIPVPCQIPVVFIHGDWDRYTPIENTLEIAPFFPNSHTLLIDRGGHAGLRDVNKHPEVMEALMDFAKTGTMVGIPERIAVEPDLGHNKELPRINPATLSK